MNVDKKTQIGKTKKNKRTLPSEPVSELSDEMQISSPQFVTTGKKQIIFYVINSISYFTPAFKSGLSCLKQFWQLKKPFKNDEKCFLFHLKTSFRSQDIYVFVSTF